MYVLLIYFIYSVSYTVYICPSVCLGLVIILTFFDIKVIVYVQQSAHAHGGRRYSDDDVMSSA